MNLSRKTQVNEIEGEYSKYGDAKITTNQPSVFP